MRKFKVRGLLAAATAATVVPSAHATPVISESSPYVGVTLYDVSDTITDSFGTNRGYHYTLAQVDLGAKGISFSTTPGNGSASNETNTQTTASYLTTTGAAVAVNANYFNFDGNPTTTLVTLETSAASQVSPWSGSAGDVGINISAANAVTFIKPKAAVADYNAVSIADGSAVSLYNAVGSNYMSVKNGVKTGAVDDAGDFARTSVGTKGNSLYLFTVDNYSANDHGLTPVEVGTLLHDTWGLTNVMNLDGGGSSQMAIRTSRGTTYFDTPESPTAPRAVGSNLAVYATNAASAVNTLDDFETTDAATGIAKLAAGHFAGTPADSGSNANVATTSIATRIATQAHTGSGSMELILNDSSTTAGFTERFLSTAARSYSNVRFASSGYLGLWVKTSTANVTVSPVVDDDYTGNDLVDGTAKTLTADGQWHLYQWNLADATQWNSYFNDTDGAVTSAGVNLNSILFSSTVPENATVYFDDVAWTESGAIPVPEPVGVLVPLGMALVGRRRRAVRV